MMARDVLVPVVALHRILPALLIATAPVMMKPELAGINESRSVNTPFWRMSPTRVIGLYFAFLCGAAGLISI